MDAQEKRIRAYALLHDVDLVNVEADFDEFSGDLDRPGVQRVLKMVREKTVDAVIITKLDRLSRSVSDTSSLMDLFRKTGVKLIDIAQSIDMSCAIGTFIVNIRAAVHQYEREITGERTSEGLQNIKSQGFPAGPAPFGYKSQERTEKEKTDKIRKPLLEDPQEQKILARIKELQAKDMTWPAIAGILNREGYRTRSGGKWQYQAVHRIFNKVILKRAA